MESTATDCPAKKSFQMPTVYTILFAIIGLVAIMTWIVPAGHYDYLTADTHQLIKAADSANYSGGERLLPVPGSYVELPSSPQGLEALLIAPIKGFHKAADVALFVLVIGGFLAVTVRTGAMDAGIAAIVERFKGREKFLIPVMMILFGIGGSTFGMAEETVAFWALLLPVMTAAGYDRMVTAGVILLGSGVGVLTSTVNPFATGIASRFADLQIGDGIGLRLVMFAVLMSAAITYVMRYAAKVKTSPAQSVLDDVVFNDELSKEVQAGEFTPAKKLTMGIFFATFMLMIYSVIPWSDMGITAIPTLGWWFDDLSMLFLTSSIVIALVNRMPEADFIDALIEGARDLISVALVVAVAPGIYIVMGDGAIIDTILHWAEGMVNGLPSSIFLVASYFVHIILSFFIPSTSGLATVSMPLMGPLADFSHVGRDLVVTAYQSASGWINMFAPTASHLVAGLALARIPYARFVKWVTPFIVFTLVATTVMLFIAAAMG